MLGDTSLPTEARHLSNKIAQICSQLDSSLGTGPVEVPRTQSCPVIWDEFDPDEADRILVTMSLATYLLDPCPAWLVMASQEVRCGQVPAMVNSSLREEVVPPPLKAVLTCPLLSWTIFTQYPTFPF